MTITNFTVQFDLFTGQSDGTDTGIDVDIIGLTGTVTFTPYVADARPVMTDYPGGFVFRDCQGHLDADGKLRAHPGGPVGVRLWANDPVFNLPSLVYLVTFDVTTPLGEPVRVDGGYFAAPADDTVVQLGQVLGSAAIPPVQGMTRLTGYIEDIADSGEVGRQLVRSSTTVAAWAALGSVPARYSRTFHNIGTVSGSCVLDLSDGALQECTLSVSHNSGYSPGPDTCVFTLPQMPAGSELTLVVRQPVTGTGKGRYAVGNATFPGVVWSNGVPPTLTPALRTADVFRFTSDGTTIFGSASQGHIYHAPFGYAASLGPRRQKGTANPSLIPDGPNFWTPPDIATAYQFPDVDGTGVTVGCLQFSAPPSIPAIQAYCNYLGIDRTLDMELIWLPGTDSTTAPSDGASGEAMLDMCVLASLVPGAKHKVYQAPNTPQGFLDGATRALAECDLVTSSWFYNEISPWDESVYTYPLPMMLEFEDVLKEARGRSVSFFTASGDWGADVWTPYYAGGVVPWQASPRRLGFPATCPSAVSVGQTALHLDSNGLRVSEEATLYWPTYSTGGYSRVFPDTKCPVVSCFGEFQQGYAVVMPSGGWAYMSSTSGSAPTMAALHARLIQTRGSRFDFMDFALAHPDAFYDVTIGTNGAFDCHPGRDLVTGIGTPNGPAMVSALNSWE